MRLRPITALSLVAAAAILLAGCTSSSTPEADAEAKPTGTPSDLCSAAIATGDVAASVEVSGDVGSKPEVTFPAPLEITESERAVIAEGDKNLTGGEFVTAAYTVFDADSGEELGSIGYEPGEVLPEQVSPEGSGQLMGCAGPGSRIVAVAPKGESNPGLVYVIDVLEVVPTAAWGEQQDAPEGMPAVELAEDGAPTITIPDAEPPTEVKVATLKKGDGITVEEGDTVLVQYTGVRWSDGEVFDSSWDRGMPTSFQTTGVVAGFKQALEGQTVGSQVEVVIPPAQAYGEKEIDGEPNTHELAGETLVFVVDILGTQHAPTQ